MKTERSLFELQFHYSLKHTFKDRKQPATHHCHPARAFLTTTAMYFAQILHLQFFYSFFGFHLTFQDSDFNDEFYASAFYSKQHFQALCYFPFCFFYAGLQGALSTKARNPHAKINYSCAGRGRPPHASRQPGWTRSLVQGSAGG